jgi:hypothetical protein
MHYRKQNEDLYFLANMAQKNLKFNAEFRCRAPRIELRWPGSGRIESAAFSPRAGRSRLKLCLPALESVIVAFVR